MQQKKAQKDLYRILACPLCKSELRAGNETLNKRNAAKAKEVVCSKCSRKYPAKGGIINFRVAEKRKAAGAKNDWDVSVFESAYKKTGSYIDPYEWRKYRGVPKIVTDYDLPLIKGTLFRWLNPNEGDVILDLGCGSGWMIFEAMKMYKGKELYFIGLDISEHHIKALFDRAKKEKKSNVVGVIADAEALPFKDKAFNEVYSSEVIEHVVHPQKAVNDVNRILSEGGRFMLSTPSRRAIVMWESIFYIPKKIYNLGKKQPNKKEAYDDPMSNKELLEVLKKGGFKVISFEMNVLLPTQNYFAKIPMPVTWAIVKTAGFLEHNLKFLFGGFALHMLAHAKKEEDIKEQELFSKKEGH